MRLLRVVAPVPPEVTASAFPRESVPRVAACEKRFVLDAVVAKKAVDVAPPCPIERTVVLAFVTASKSEPVPHAAGQSGRVYEALSGLRLSAFWQRPHPRRVFVPL